jgi:hypothetical protein
MQILLVTPRPLAIALVFFAQAAALHAETSLEYELDAYYSNLGYYIGLTDQPIPVITNDDETANYQNMLDSTLQWPRFLLIEASVNPLPVLGVYLKKNQRDFYDKAEIRGNINLLQAFTEGFEEPYALSFFLGSVVRFSKPGEAEKVSNRGYSGYLLSMGTRHIVNNDLIDDNWYELEWKIKGDNDFEYKTLSWSLRVGSKVHSNVDIADIVYFGLRRNHLDSAAQHTSWFDNSDIDYKLSLNTADYNVVEQSLFINKKWPTPLAKKSAFEFGVGFILERNKYFGSLATQADDFKLILRPSFKF